MKLLALALGVTVWTAPIAAQSTGGIQSPRAPIDSAVRRPAPLNFFFRSLLIPGWGQAALDRKLTGGLFVMFEGLSWSMMLKSNVEQRYLDRADTTTATFRKSERQDWIALIVFNHLFSALEAYVSAHLLDFPADLHAQVLPGGRTGFGITIPIRHQ